MLLLDLLEHSTCAGNLSAQVIRSGSQIGHWRRSAAAAAAAAASAAGSCRLLCTCCCQHLAVRPCKHLLLELAAGAGCTPTRAGDQAGWRAGFRRRRFDAHWTTCSLFAGLAEHQHSEAGRPKVPQRRPARPGCLAPPPCPHRIDCRVSASHLPNSASASPTAAPSRSFSTSARARPTKKASSMPRLSCWAAGGDHTARRGTAAFGFTAAGGAAWLSSHPESRCAVTARNEGQQVDGPGKREAAGGRCCRSPLTAGSLLRCAALLRTSRRFAGLERCVVGRVGRWSGPATSWVAAESVAAIPQFQVFCIPLSG